jgi:hypothetical protein
VSTEAGSSTAVALEEDSAMLGVRRGHVGENFIVAPAGGEAPRPEEGEHDPAKDYGKGAEGDLRPNFHSESVVRITLRSTAGGFSKARDSAPL